MYAISHKICLDRSKLFQFIKAYLGTNMVCVFFVFFLACWGMVSHIFYIYTILIEISVCQNHGLIFLVISHLHFLYHSSTFSFTKFVGITLTDGIFYNLQKKGFVGFCSLTLLFDHP